MKSYQKKQLREALLDAFPEPGDMEMVVDDAGIETAFAEYLAVPGTKYSHALYHLISEAEAQGRVEDLLRTARESKPGNCKLQGIFTELAVGIEKELVGLEPLLDSLEKRTDGWMLYDRIAKPGWKPRLGPGASLTDLARNLARMTERQEKGRRFVPLLAFVEGLCKRIKQGKDLGEVRPLKGWLKQTKQALGVPPGAGAALIEHQGPVDGGYGLVQIRPLQFAEGASPRGRPGYGVKAWLLGTDRDQALLGGRGRAGSRRRSTMWRRNFPRC